jgi:hypothetical protein
MRWVFWGHEIPAAAAVPIPWRQVNGQYVARVEVGRRMARLEQSNHVVRLVDHGQISWIASAVKTPKEAAYSWAAGAPAVVVEPWSWAAGQEAVMDLAGRCLPLLRPLPASLLARGLGFRVDCRAPSGERPVAWWRWKGTESPQCVQALFPPTEHGAPPERRCTCGFHIAATPWEVAVFARTLGYRTLVVAPWGRTVLHQDASGTGGARAEHYDVLAVVAPLDMPTKGQEIADPRFARARNCALRAWEIAQEILAFRAIGGDA